MRTTLRLALVATLVAFSSAFTSAQVVTDVVTAAGAFVEDDGYDGSLASMGCSSHDFSASMITNILDVELQTAISHTWIGDLTIKVVDPDGDILTVLNRPGGQFPDDGTGCCGDSSDMSADFPLTYGDQFTDPAETMGDTILGTEVVCRDDGRCEYMPSPDGAAGVDFAQFNGQAAAGVWQVCVGDSVGGDPADFVSATLTITGETGPGGKCDLDFSATASPTTVDPGDVVTFGVSVANTGDDPILAALQLEASGPASMSRSLGSRTIAAGAAVNRNINVRVPGGAPAGTYNVALILTADGEQCETEQFTITVSGARVAANEVKSEVEHRVGAPARPELQFELVGEGFGEASAVTGVVGVAPNPFVGQSAITFEVAEAAQARLAVYDVLGRQVAVLVDGQVEAGVHTATFDARGLSAGTYVYRLQVGNDVQTGRMTLAH